MSIHNSARKGTKFFSNKRTFSLKNAKKVFFYVKIVKFSIFLLLKRGYLRKKL